MTTYLDNAKRKFPKVDFANPANVAYHECRRAHTQHMGGGAVHLGASVSGSEGVKMGIMRALERKHELTISDLCRTLKLSSYDVQPLLLEMHKAGRLERLNVYGIILWKIAPDSEKHD